MLVANQFVVYSQTLHKLDWKTFLTYEEALLSTSFFLQNFVLYRYGLDANSVTQVR